MKTLPNRQLKCLIVESSGIIAAELEDELRFAFDAKIIPLSHPVSPEDIDIAILDCPISMPVLLSLVDQLRAKTRAFIFTHTHDLPFEVVQKDIVYRNVPKPYPMTSVLNVISDLIDEMGLRDTA